MITIKAICFYADLGWIVQCLDLDICAQGSTIAEAITSFEQVIAGEVATGNYEALKPPPDYYKTAPRWRLIDLRPVRQFDWPDGKPLLTLDVKYFLSERPVAVEGGLKIVIPFDSDQRSIIKDDSTGLERADFFIGELPFVCAIREALELRRLDRDRKVTKKLGGADDGEKRNA